MRKKSFISAQYLSVVLTLDLSSLVDFTTTKTANIKTNCVSKRERELLSHFFRSRLFHPIIRKRAIDRFVFVLYYSLEALKKV